MCGLSMGGVHANMVASLYPGAVALTPLLSPRSAAGAYCSGALYHATAWSQVGTHCLLYLFASGGLQPFTQTADGCAVCTSESMGQCCESAVDGHPSHLPATVPSPWQILPTCSARMQQVLPSLFVPLHSARALKPFPATIRPS